jgi:DNA-directed RNA polymerase specialized sigma24 family protein
MISVEAAERAMRSALEIANARGSELLVALGRFDAWRGDLASMRGDTPMTIADAPANIEVPAIDTDNVLIVAGALRRLSPRCRETLSLRYVEGRAGKELARASNMTEKHATELAENCFSRMMHIIESVSDGTVGAVAGDRTDPEGTPHKIHPLPVR